MEGQHGAADNQRPTPDYPDFDFLNHFLSHGFIYGPKRLWHSSGLIVVVSLVIFGVGVGLPPYRLGEACAALSITAGVLGTLAGILGGIGVLTNKAGRPMYLNLLNLSFLIGIVFAICEVISSIVSISTIYYKDVGALTSLLVFGLVQLSALVYGSYQIKDRVNGTGYLNFGGSSGASALGANMSAFVNRWNNTEGNCCSLATRTRMKKSLRSERCVMWCLTIFYLLSGLTIIGIGLFHIFENKMTMITMTFAPFWNGCVVVLCSIMGFVALSRKTLGLGLTFLASGIPVFCVSLAFMILACFDIDERKRCLSHEGCAQYITDKEALLFYATYAGFGVIAGFQIIFSFVGVILFFNTLCSCSGRAEREESLDAPPAYVESSANFDPVSGRY